MSAAATPKLLGYGALAAAGLFGALVLGRPELAVLATPFALVTGLGLVLARRPGLEIVVEPPRERALQGESIDLAVGIRSDVRLEALELLVDLPAGLSVDERAVAVPVPARTP